ncbi:phytanoyl-CoA dioxygenase family protein [Endothiovibrio diazotrophicus]
MKEEFAQRFTQHGVAVVEGAVPPAALRWANETVGRFIDRQLTYPPAPGVARVEHDGRNHVISIGRLVPNLGALPLYLMGLPAVAEAARAACGPDAVCTHDWMVVKSAGDGQRIDWHQDIAHDGRHTAVNVGIHLDEVGQDAVRFIPGPRRGVADVGALREQYDYDSPGLIAPTLSAGDLAVHDVLLVHGSPPLAHGRRKTLYLEFRDPAMLVDHPGIPAAYVALRHRLLAAAQRLYQRLGDAPEGDPATLLDEESRQLIEALETHQIFLEPANYGYFGGQY